jgi:hypothetical protein
MADGDDSEAEGGDKARGFSAEDLAALRVTLPMWSGALSAWCFGEILRVWLLRYPDPYGDQERARKAAKIRRDGKRDDLRTIVSNIDAISCILSRMTDNYDHRAIIFQLEPQHDPNPPLLMGDWEREKIGGAKLNALIDSMNTLRAAAERAVESEKIGGGRMYEWIVRAALTDLGRIYHAATGHLPTGSNDGTGHNGAWPAFARASALRGWGSSDALTLHLREVEKFLRQERAQLIKRRKLEQKATFARQARIVAYYARLSPSQGEGT